MRSSDDIGQAVVFLAAKAALSQSELAVAASVSDKTISAWSNGRQRPSMRALKRVVHALGLTGQELEEVTDFHRKWRLRMGRAGAETTAPSPARASAPPFEDDYYRELGRTVARLCDLLTQGPAKDRAS